MREPELGTIVYCKFAGGLLEHSGIYAGYGQIISFVKTEHGITKATGRAVVKKESPRDFLVPGSGYNEIYAMITDSYYPHVGIDTLNVAQKWVGIEARYDVLTKKHCHNFVGTCIQLATKKDYNYVKNWKYSIMKVLPIPGSGIIAEALEIVNMPFNSLETLVSEAYCGGTGFFGGKKFKWEKWDY